MHKSSSVSLRNVVVVASVSLIGFLISGTARLSALLFVTSIERFGTGRKEASLPFILSYTFGNLSGPIVGYLGNKYGLKSVTMSGCLLAAVGVGGCYFVEDIVPFTVLWGGCFGIGFGMGTSLIPNILNLHFKETFNRMYGIMLSSSCLGSLVMPVITDSLLKNYGISGALLILSSLILHCIPAAMLLSKPEMPQTHQSHSNHKDTNQSVQQKVKESMTAKRYENSPILNGEYRDRTTVKAKSQSQTNSLPLYKPLISSHNELETITSLKTNTIDLSPRISTESKILALPISYDVQAVENINNVMTVESHIPTEIVLNERSKHIEFQEILSDTEVARKSYDATSIESSATPIDMSKLLPSSSALHKFEIFLDPAYILILVSASFALMVVTTLFTVIVDVCRDKGLTEDVTVLILVIFGLTDMLGRFSFGYMADGGYISPLNLFALCCGSCGLLFIGFTWFSGFYAVMLFVAGFGTLTGGICVLPVGIIKNYIQKENLTMAFSSRYFLFTFLSFSQSPMIGYFRETLRSYNGMLYLLGCICFIGTSITLFVPLAARRRDIRRNSRNKVHNIVMYPEERPV